MTTLQHQRVKVKSVKKLTNYQDEYVYDVGIDDKTPYFFGNGILVHNSSYFSAYKVLMDEGVPFNKETIIELYDHIGDTVNDSFPEFMDKNFNTGVDRGGIIAAGRELVASKGLFIKKKKYAVLMYDKEGKRLDTDGKPGKLKVMGLDLKRSDTPQFMQDFLAEVLTSLLVEGSKEKIFDMVKQFRKDFTSRPGWEKGTPKKVNGLTDYSTRDAKAKSFGSTDITKMRTGEKTKINMPGHVRAAINWNTLKELNHDMYSSTISDGAKVIVCKLKPNPMNIDSIAWPVDDARIPDWYKELPFDNAAMEKTIIDFKLDNLLGVLGWDLSIADESVDNDLFSW